MIKFLTAKKWPLILVVALTTTRCTYAALSLDHHQKPYDQKHRQAVFQQLKEDMKDKQLLEQMAEQTCKLAKLNPKYGLADICPDLNYSYSSALRLMIVNDPVILPSFARLWKQLYGLVEDKNELRFTALQVAEVLRRATNSEIVGEYQQRKRQLAAVTEQIKHAEMLSGAKDVERAKELQHERDLGDVRDKNKAKEHKRSLDKMYKSAKLMFDAMKYAISHPAEIFTIAAYILVLFAAISAGFYGVKYTFLALYRWLTDTKPILVKQQRLSMWLPWTIWRTKVASNVKELHYSKNLQAWLDQSLKYDKDRVQANVAGGHYKFSSVLLKGPPGTGKTALAREYATAADFDFLHIGGSSFLQLPEDEAIKEFLYLLRKAERNSWPLVFFIDEVDVIFGSRLKTTGAARRLTSAFLESIDKAHHHNIKFIFATNLPDEVSKAILSRCAEQLDVGMPTEAKAKAIYQTYMEKYTKLHGLSYDKDADLTLKGLTGRAIEELCLRLSEKTRLNGLKNIKANVIAAQFAHKIPDLQKKKDEYNLLYWLGGLALLLAIIIFLLRLRRKKRNY